MHRHHGPRALAIVLALLSLGFAPPAGASLSWIHAGWENLSHEPTSLGWYSPYGCGSATPPSFAAIVGVDVDFGPVHRLEATVDFCTAPQPLPSFWVGAPGCTPMSFRAEVAHTSVGGSPIYWDGSATASLVYMPYFEGSMVRGRVLVTVEQDPLVAAPLPTAGEFSAFRLRLDLADASCPGCEVNGCFMLNGVTVWNAEGDMRFYGPYEQAYGYWSGGNFNCPFIVPVAQQSFGALKAALRR